MWRRIAFTKKSKFSKVVRVDKSKGGKLKETGNFK